MTAMPQPPDTASSVPACPVACPERPPRALARLARAVQAQGLLQENAPKAPPSPCIRICAMTGADGPGPAHCQGCYRQLAEIARWGSASAAEQRAIWRALLQRAGLD
ncbi:MAG: DUF1289 domain-containing protein [Comamonadaceae bacterium]|nr:DUF1289 domain-containing protein [Comamonadaceae bacterium]